MMRHESVPRRLGCAIALLVLLMTIGAGGAQAKSSPLVQLRIEGDTSSIDPGTWYVPGSAIIKRATGSDNCVAKSGAKLFRGRNALSIVGAAADVNPAVAPVRFRNTDFGPQLCGINGLRSFGHYPDASGGWLFWNNYISGASSPDHAPVAAGDKVLWYYAGYPAALKSPAVPSNTGPPLELKAVPARTKTGEFTVRVVEHDYDGTPMPLEGATITGAQQVTETGGGHYDIVAKPGFSKLKAKDGLDVRSAAVETCRNVKASKCPRAHGRRIRGSRKRDGLLGTAGWDDIRANAGNDRINIRSGGRDRVRCGAGKDIVLKRKRDRNDRIASNCETVRSG